MDTGQHQGFPPRWLCGLQTFRRAAPRAACPDPLAVFVFSGALLSFYLLNQRNMLRAPPFLHLINPPRAALYVPLTTTTTTTTATGADRRLPAFLISLLNGSLGAGALLRLLLHIFFQIYFLSH